MFPIPKHTLIVDTNILRDNDVRILINDKFISFWNEHSNKYKLSLIIPDIVKGELLFQTISSASKKVDRLKEELTKLSAIANSKYSLKLPKDNPTQSINKNFNTWLKSTKGKVIKVPIDKVNWKNLIHSAINFSPPFKRQDSKGSGDRDDDGGFKDSLILETIFDYASSNPEENIAFITGDTSLREAASKKLSKFKKFSSYESLESFVSHLKLLDEGLTESFVTSISARAAIKFYSETDPNCIYINNKIPQLIQEQFKGKLFPPNDPKKETLFSLKFSEQDYWIPSSEVIFSPLTTSFNRREESNRYFWASNVISIQLFQSKEEQPTPNPFISGGLFGTKPEDFSYSEEGWVLWVEFKVHWNANVMKDRRFYDLKYEKIIFIKQNFMLRKKLFEREQLKAK